MDPPLIIDRPAPVTHTGAARNRAHHTTGAGASKRPSAGHLHANQLAGRAPSPDLPGDQAASPAIPPDLASTTPTGAETEERAALPRAPGAACTA
jgi:hypothetical protein